MADKKEKAPELNAKKLNKEELFSLAYAYHVYATELEERVKVLDRLAYTAKRANGNIYGALVTAGLIVPKTESDDVSDDDEGGDA